MYGFGKEFFGIAWNFGEDNIQHEDSLKTIAEVEVEHDVFGLDLEGFLKAVSDMDLGERLVVEVALLW